MLSVSPVPVLCDEESDDAFGSFPVEDALADIGNFVLALPWKKPKKCEAVDLFIVADVKEVRSGLMWRVHLLCWRVTINRNWIIQYVRNGVVQQLNPRRVMRVL